MAPLVIAAVVAALADAQVGAAAPPTHEASPEPPRGPLTPEDRWRVRIAFGLRATVLASESAVSFGGGYDLTVEAGRFCAGAIGAVTLGDASRHALVLGGAGISRPMGRLTGHALLVGGTHWIHVDERDGPGWQAHLLPAAGLRVGVHELRGLARILGYGAIEATLLRDLVTEDDAFPGRVGGWSVGISVSGALGLGFGREGAPGEGG